MNLIICACFFFRLHTSYTLLPLHLLCMFICLLSPSWALFTLSCALGTFLLQPLTELDLTFVWRHGLQICIHRHVLITHRPPDVQPPCCLISPHTENTRCTSSALRFTEYYSGHFSLCTFTVAYVNGIIQMGASTK